MLEGVPTLCEECFSHNDLDVEIYMSQLEGFIIPGNESHLCKLKKSLYGLKKAPKA